MDLGGNMGETAVFTLLAGGVDDTKTSTITVTEDEINLSTTTMSGSITIIGDINSSLNDSIPIGLKSNATAAVIGSSTTTTNKSALVYNHNAYGSSSLGISLSTTSGGMQDGASTVGKTFSYTSGSGQTSITEFSGKTSSPGRTPYLSAITTLRNDLNFSYINGISQNAASFGVLAASDTSGSVGIGANMGVSKSSYLFIAAESGSVGVRVLSNEPTLFSVQRASGLTITDLLKVNQSGSLTLAVTSSTAPSWTGSNGEIVPATVGGKYFLYMWMNGAWRSGSFS
jgi:hypothetical protein